MADYASEFLRLRYPRHGLGGLGRRVGADAASNQFRRPGNVRG
jgi:hypothetical protein